MQYAPQRGFSDFKMLNINVKDFIRLKKLEESKIQVKEKWCEEQEKDVERMIEMIDDLIITAISSTSSSQGYTLLQEARSTFLKEFMDVSAKYRHI